MTDYYLRSVELHRLNQGKIGVVPRVEVTNRDDLSLVYTPGVAQVSREIAESPNKSFELTWRGRVVAIISDGSAVLGLGNVGEAAAMPVMEGKALLLSQFAGVSAVPLVVSAHSEDELVDLVTKLAPSFGAINLEDIAAPICFGVEDRLQNLGIPVFHDDQHGTAIVVRAAIKNAAKVLGKEYRDLRVVVSGAGAAGLAVSQMLLGLERQDGKLVKVSEEHVRDLLIVDSQGAIYQGREGLSGWKKQFAEHTNKAGIKGSLAEAVKGADVFVGVSRGGVLSPQMVREMGNDSIVFAMANPDPEITYEEAVKAGAAVVGTGRSDYPNQINNSLAFPGVFAGALTGRATKITLNMKIAASDELASSIVPTRDEILPSMLLPGLAGRIAKRVAHQAQIDNVIRY